MKDVSQRELRNHSGEIVRGLARGEAYRLTSRGVPVGVVRPVGESDLEQMVLRRGSGRMSFPRGVLRPETTAQTLDELRADE